MNVLKKIGIGILSIFVLLIVFALIFGESETETNDPATENDNVETRTESIPEERKEEKENLQLNMTKNIW